MAFVKKQGRTKMMWYPMTASTVAGEGALMEAVSGQLVVATNTTKCHNIVGVLVKAIVATDADYATAGRLVAVRVPVEKWVTWTAPVNVGTLATTSVGAYFDTSTDDLGAAVDQSASAENVVFCTKFLSATSGEFVLNIGPESVGDID